MNRWLKSSIVTFISVVLVLFIGCSAIQDVVTPTYVDEGAAEWANQPTKLLLPYTTLWDAKRIKFGLDYQFTLEKMKYGYYSNITNLSIIGGEEIKQIVFSPEGPIAPLLMVLGGGTLGGLLVKRPGDKSKKEIEEENKIRNSVNNAANQKRF